MPDLTIIVASASPVAYAAAPTIAFELGVQNLDPAESIHTAILRCQFQIEVTRRAYNPREKEQLSDLFGAPERWGQTLRSMLWTHASVVLPTFTNSTSVTVPVTCTFDFNVAATKYFGGLLEGDIPLCLMFSGTVFYADGEGSTKVAPVSWEKETRFRLSVSTWKDMMELYYPNCVWLNLRRDVFEKLHHYKMRHAIPTWEEAFEKMLEASQADAKVPVTRDSAASLVARLEALRWKH